MKNTAITLLSITILLCSCAPAAPLLPPALEAATTPTAIPTDTPTPEPTPTATPMSLSDRVREFMAGNIEFPSDLTGEQYSAFIKEMNVQRGAKPIYVELDGKTMYLSKETRKMETISGSYLENKGLIDQNSFPLFAEVYHEEGQDLQYVHPDTGELMTLPKSADVDWTHVVNAENFNDGYMQLAPGEITDWFTEYLGTSKTNEYVQGILLDKQPITLVCLQGTYGHYPTLNMLSMRTNEQGKPLYAVRVFYGTVGLIFRIVKENNPVYEKLIYSSIAANQL